MLHLVRICIKFDASCRQTRHLRPICANGDADQPQMNRLGPSCDNTGTRPPVLVALDRRARAETEK